ncbi:hypothetical protein ILUMI_07939, partial [Ignelater luminosus]
EGDRCVTPNGEVAKCTSLINCNIIGDALRNKTEGAADFARKSQCGKIGKAPLVCCGTSAKLTFIAPKPPCTTPNGEAASCIPISSCKAIMDAINTQNKDAIEFSKKSQCGFDKEQLVCCGSEAYPLRTNLLPNRTVCGEQKGDVRIHGGEVTQIWEFPWMVLLGYRNNDGTDGGFRCGGSVINNRYILTAAHCVSLRARLNIRVDRVRLGEWRISTAEDCDEGVSVNCADPVVEINIEKKIVHPEYRRVEGKNDIALLRLEKNIQFSNYIQPICLPVRESPDSSPNSEMHVAGWGATENSSYSDVKLKLKLRVVSRSYCNEKLSDIGGAGPLQMCAGGEGKKDSCQGDSGGPLMRSFSENENAKPKWYQEGVVSRGKGCGMVGFPGIYTRVASYMDWIIENLESS